MVTKSTSLLAQESTGTSGSGFGLDPSNAINDTPSTGTLRQGFTVSMTSSTGHRPGWPTTVGRTSPALGSSTKGKLPGNTDEGESQPFLSITFDREDFLLAIGESDDESDDDDDTYQADDSRPSQHAPTPEVGSLPLMSPAESSREGKPSLHRRDTIRSIYATHLLSRQPIVNKIKVHQNLDLSNLFGNMPFSSSIQANHFPPEIQNQQISNLALPTWSILPINTRADPGSLKTGIPLILEEATNMIKQGVPIDHIIEPYPNVAALFDREIFNRSCMLTRWAVSMVHSTQLKGMFAL